MRAAQAREAAEGDDGARQVAGGRAEGGQRGRHEGPQEVSERG